MHERRAKLSVRRRPARPDVLDAVEAAVDVAKREAAEIGELELGEEAAVSASSSALRPTGKKSSSGHSASTTSVAASVPQDCTTSRRPPGFRDRASGPRIFSALNFALVRARHGCDARTKS